MLTTGRFTSILVGLDTLRVNPLRTALSTLGIVMGSASLVAVLALGDGLQRFVRTQLERSTDLHAISVSANTTRSVDGMRFPRADTVEFDRALARELTDSLPGLAAVSLTMVGGGRARTGEHRPKRPMGERPQATVPLETAGPLREALENRLAARYDAWKERIQVTANDSRLRQTLQGMQVAKLVMGAITGISLLGSGVSGGVGAGGHHRGVGVRVLSGAPGGAAVAY